MSERNAGRDRAVWPGRGAPVSLFPAANEFGAFARAVVRPTPVPREAARGAGQPVLVLPGLSSPDAATGRLRLFLKKQGFAPHPWGLGPNLGPTAGTMRRIAGELARLADRHQQKVALVGLSMGGIVAREVARRHPEHVARVITLGAPIKGPVTTPLAPLVHIVSFAWERDADRSATTTQFPVPLTAIVTKDDGLVDWRTCVPDSAPNVDVAFVRGPHVTLGSNPDAQRIVADRIARDAGDAATPTSSARTPT